MLPVQYDLEFRFLAKDGKVPHQTRVSLGLNKTSLGDGSDEDWVPPPGTQSLLKHLILSNTVHLAIDHFGY